MRLKLIEENLDRFKCILESSCFHGEIRIFLLSFMLARVMLAFRPFLSTMLSGNIKVLASLVSRLVATKLHSAHLPKKPRC